MRDLGLQENRKHRLRGGRKTSTAWVNDLRLYMAVSDHCFLGFLTPLVDTKDIIAVHQLPWLMIEVASLLGSLYKIGYDINYASPFLSSNLCQPQQALTPPRKRRGSPRSAWWSPLSCGACGARRNHRSIQSHGPWARVLVRSVLFFFEVPWMADLGGSILNCVGDVSGFS